MPLLATPWKYDMWAIHSSASNAIHGNSTFTRGTASTASGTSHSEYWGLHTLLVRRKIATMRNASCAMRGVVAAVKPITRTATQPSANSTSDTMFRVAGASPAARPASNPAHPVRTWIAA